jgi:ABC-type multidrug transport system ATPase subunit
VDGNVWVNGQPLDPNLFREQAKYVEQEDHLFEVLSVEETLTYAAELQVRERKERRGRVEAALGRLGLESARDTKVGGTFFRGCSGGQRRRVAIGVELVAQPEVLLLDEPTSGLDSSSAQQVMMHLQEISRSGVAVICTIHQPSQRVFELSDKLMLLAGGRTVYFGPTAGAVAYFTRHGAALPGHTSVPEFLLEQVNSDFHDSNARVDELTAAWVAGDEKRVLDEEVESWVSGGGGDPAGKGGVGRRAIARSVSYKRGALAQVAVLAARNAKDATRNPAVIYLRFAMYLALSVMIGICWLRVPARADRIQDLVSTVERQARSLAPHRPRCRT